jgi:hypothetical protein
MEILDRRKVDAMGESRPEELEQYDDFRPTLAGFEPLFDSVLLRELKLPDESAIVTPDAFAEPCLYCEVIAGDAPKGIARILKGSPRRPKQGYWMLMEWDGPETFGSEAMWFYLHRDETTGLSTLGPYPHKGRYKIAVKLIWTTVDEGALQIEPWPLNSAIIDMIIPVILAGRKDSVARRKQFAAAERAQAERKIDTAIEAVMKDAKRPMLLPSKIDDRIRLMEKQWAAYLNNPRKFEQGIRQITA